MTTPENAKGSQYERDVVKYLQEHGFPNARRRYGAGNTKDEGDIIGVPAFVLEAKNQKAIRLAEFMDEVQDEKGNAGAVFGAAVIKRRNRPIGASYVVMSLLDFTFLLREGEQ